MKHPLLLMCGLVVVILFTALLAPFLIDWSAFRAEIETEAERLIGRQVVINGKIDIRLLPRGVIRLGDVAVKARDNPDNSANAALANIQIVKAKLALAPLLRGQFQFMDVELVNPIFRLEISPDGRPNWDRGAPSKLGGLIDPQNIILDEVLISQGSVVFKDAKHGLAYKIAPVNAQVSARSLEGPYVATFATMALS